MLAKAVSLLLTCVSPYKHQCALSLAKKVTVYVTLNVYVPAAVLLAFPALLQSL